MRRIWYEKKLDLGVQTQQKSEIFISIDIEDRMVLCCGEAHVVTARVVDWGCEARVVDPGWG